MDAPITRRKFGLGLTMGVAGGASVTQAEEPPKPFATETVDQLRLIDHENPAARVELHLAVKALGEDDLEIKPSKYENGPPSYFWQGRALPELFWPNGTMITRFDLRWNGRKVSVAERFWNDLPHMRLERLKIPYGTDPNTLMFNETFINQRRKGWGPWLKLSDHQGTVMVTWPKPEE